MNENEAMKDLIKHRQGSARKVERLKSDGRDFSHFQTCVDSIDIAIKALEEIQQYRELGTVEELRESMEMKQKYEKQWIDDINNPLEPLKLSSALQSEIFKLEYRKANKPKEINILDYTIIYALKDCLERYSGIREE